MACINVSAIAILCGCRDSIMLVALATSCICDMQVNSHNGYDHDFNFLFGASQKMTVDEGGRGLTEYDIII